MGGCVGDAVAKRQVVRRSLLCKSVLHCVLMYLMVSTDSGLTVSEEGDIEAVREQ